MERKILVEQLLRKNSSQGVCSTRAYAQTGGGIAILENTQGSLDIALSYLYQIQIFEADPTVSRRWDQMTSIAKVLSHLNSSVILTCLMTCVLRY